MKRIAVIPNGEKADAIKLATELIKEFPDNLILYSEDNMEEKFDTALVLGGDGTMLRAVKKCEDVALFGINFGALGYMSGAEKTEAFSAVKKIISGDYKIEKRMMLDITVKRGDEVVAKAVALNDGVISRNERILSISAYFNNRLVYSFLGDGIIVATPTGSTAYSLSAGGPVAPPEMEVMLATPVCPHSIHIRPLLASPDTEIKIVIEDNDGIGTLNVDGQNILKLAPGDEIYFKKSASEAKLISLEDNNFYDILRYKLSDGKRR